MPQILITRKKLNDGATYIWPKHNTKELKKFLQYLRQIIQYRTCPLAQFNQKKLCSDYYFQLCKGRCAKSDLPAPDYNKLIVSFFKGNTKPIEEKIKNLILEAVNTQNLNELLSLEIFIIRLISLSKNRRLSLLSRSLDICYRSAKLAHELVLLFLISERESW